MTQPTSTTAAHPPAAHLPAAPRRPRVLTAHGDERVDDWYWLADRDDPEVLAYLEAENAHTEASLAHTAGLRDQLYAEIVGRIRQSDLSVPVRKGPWLYYSRTVEGQQYPIHCRRPATDAPGAVGPATGPEPGEQVLLDENRAAAGHEFFALTGFAVSPDHNLVAWSADTTGGERATLRVRDLALAVDLPDEVEDTYYGLAWASDNATVFYTRPDQAMRPHQLWRHRVGTPVTEDVCVHTEADERFFVGVERTKDDAFLLLDLSSKVTSEVWALPAGDPTGAFSVIEPRRQGVEYYVDHLGDRFLVVTNDGAENFRLMATPEAAPARTAWTEALPYDPAVKLDGIDVFARHLVLYERAGGYRRIRVADLGDDLLPDPASLRALSQPEVVSTAWGGANPELHSSRLRYEYTSLVTPRSVYELDLDTGETTLLKRQPVLGGYEPGGYRSQRLWAEASDGEQVPISILYRDGTRQDGTAPCLLYGYGAYEASVDPTFSSSRLSLLDRGFVFAIAHVRGGGELGRRWYEGGRLAAKPNTFSDFVAAARHLVAGGWTSPERLVARGASAGGLLMGAVANAAPECFAAVVAQVPFVDCLTTISDETLPLTIIEWEEWGNPVADAEAYFAMKSWSPYDNVGPHPYPALLATAGLNDPRVGYWEPAKWVAKLRTLSPTTAVLLKTELGAGHQGPSGRYEAWREEAFVQAFILDALGLAGDGDGDGAGPGDP